MGTKTQSELFHTAVVALCDRHTFSVADWTASFLDGEIDADALRKHAAEVFDRCTASGRDCTS